MSTGLRRNKYIVVGGIIVLICLVVILITIMLLQPERSVASFCRVAKEEKSVLTGNVDYEKRLDSAIISQEPVSGETILLKDTGSADIAKQVMEASRKNYATKYRKPTSKIKNKSTTKAKSHEHMVAKLPGE